MPHKDPKSGLENLYHWEVHLRDFDEKSALGKDMAKLKAKSGIDYVTLEMRFSKDYPHVYVYITHYVRVGGWFADVTCRMQAAVCARGETSLRLSHGTRHHWWLHLHGAAHHFWLE